LRQTGAGEARQGEAQRRPTIQPCSGDSGQHSRRRVPHIIRPATWLRCNDPATATATMPGRRHQ